jgi:hypothetical protein
MESTFYHDTDFCLALNKVARICSHPVRAKVFESAPNHAGITCNDILIASQTIKLCKETGQPNIDLVQTHPQISSFIYKYAKTNFVFLKVFIKEPYYTLIKCDEQMTLISFLGNTGGLLGLCLGLSLISIFEMFYHLIRFCTEKFSNFFSKLVI